MIKEELGLIEDKKQPSDAAITTFAAFNLVGLIPLIHYKLTKSRFMVSTNRETNEQTSYHAVT